jgi:hypothetical protein
MSVPPLFPPLNPRPPSPSVRVEYLDFQNVGENREFRFRAYGAADSTEFRFRIAIAAFSVNRVRLQDGPDVCYQKLLKSVAAGETASPEVIVIDDAELASYREAHTKVQKHRASWVPPPPPPPTVAPQYEPRPARPAAPVVSSDTETGLAEGQRVSHAGFGLGVTTSTSRGRTVVCFDQDGPKTFVTSMVKLEVLSGPRTWESSPRGKNRPCRISPIV